MLVPSHSLFANQLTEKPDPICLKPLVVLPCVLRRVYYGRAKTVKVFVSRTAFADKIIALTL